MYKLALPFAVVLEPVAKPCFRWSPCCLAGRFPVATTVIRLVLLLFVGQMPALLIAEQPELPLRVGVFQQDVRRFYTKADGLPDDDVREIALNGDGDIVVRSARGVFVLRDGTWSKADDTESFESQRRLPEQIRNSNAIESGSTLAVATRRDGVVAVGAQEGLYWFDEKGLRKLFPSEGNRRWAPTQVFVDFDGEGRLWFASQQGVGSCKDGEWKLYRGEDGLPYDDITSVACGPNGSVWFGTKIGAVRFDGNHWSYRQGKRWLPHDDVRDVVIDVNGDVWVATAGGVAKLHGRRMTLADKAKYYEDQIDAQHRRTEFGYVIEAHTDTPGKKSGMRLSDSDNDGLWTSMYGAGECFAYGATGSLLAKRRAKAAFKALKFLSEAPKGSEHAPPSGFIARTVLETESGKDPNQGAYTWDGQREKQKDDGLWRVYSPRWPKSADGKYYWKSDTSSDELDGHYFFYPLYYDLVAETEAEKSEVREIVRANIDHLIAHDFSLHDHAGRTRWGIYGPKELNHDPNWFEERGLKSISMLSYLNVAYHMTGDEKYRKVAAELRDKHSYHINIMWPKYQRGLGSGNQSDDEMAFMSFYNLVKYEPDANLKKLYTASFANSWRQEEPEMNPFFNFCFAAVAIDVAYADSWGTHDLSPGPSWLRDSIETLKRFPLDRFDWRHTNSHRKDIVRLTHHTADVFQGTVRNMGYRRNGKVVPVDERYFNHWNHSPWRLDSGGSGRTIGTGAVFTLPYYMGLYHGFIAAD